MNIVHMTGSEIREKFLAYFESKGHQRVQSSALVPHGDPTLLFTNAGMVQFKDVFLGREQRPYRRAVTAQKCVRAGGKHNDLDSVGRTARHHTFFEMLGNFSFGDYFKREAIGYGWEFLTGVLGLPADRLWVTIYQDDDEAFQLWQEVAGVPAERIIRLGEKDNFWSMGDTGPCGPCSEILIDRGEEYRCDAPECFIGRCDCDRWLELWNLVFMQFNRDEHGNMTRLPRPSIDTGMGLERISSIMQGVYSNFDTDLLRPLIAFVENQTGKGYHGDERGFPFRVLADHARACTFLIADGVLPSNEGRGYVLRRILRRAVRFARVLGIDEPFLYRLVPEVANIMGCAYPEIAEKQEFIMRAIRADEELFLRTLSEGMRMAAEIVARVKAEGRDRIAGEEAFTLYDTFGFPLDLARDIAEENGLAVDEAGFNRAMEEQRERARAARQVAGQDIRGSLVAERGLSSRFTGYDRLTDQGTVLAIAGEGGEVGAASQGSEVWVVLDTTPFYAEGGGQVGDTGRLEGDGLAGRVLDTQRTAGAIFHRVYVDGGEIRLGQRVTGHVDGRRRRAIARNHSATHLLHRALREVLGEHVNQAGSLVSPDGLRFDFSHFSPLNPGELARIEEIVNEAILADLPVVAYETAYEQARAEGVIALFGEKYGDIVRVVKMGEFSGELCGGTHVRSTGEVGLCAILSEGSIGAGLRRIEAVTGLGVLARLRRQGEALAEAARVLKSSPEDVPGRVQELVAEIKELEKEIGALQGRLARGGAEELLAGARSLDGVRFVAGRAPVADMDALRSMAELIRDRLGGGVVVLGAVLDQRVNLVATVSRELVARGLHAGNLVREVATIVGGGGGGRPDMAQAGGKDPGRLAEALDSVEGVLRRQLEQGK